MQAARGGYLMPEGAAPDAVLTHRAAPTHVAAAVLSILSLKAPTSADLLPVMPM